MPAPILGCAKVSSDGKVTQLGPKPAGDVRLTGADVIDPPTLARTIERLINGVATLRARWYPRRIDFEDVPVASGSVLVYLAHGFNGRVRWWVVDWQSTLANKTPVLTRDASTDANTLVLVSNIDGVATIRVEEAG